MTARSLNLDSPLILLNENISVNTVSRPAAVYAQPQDTISLPFDIDIDFSSHDFCRAAIVAFGSCHIDIGALSSPVGILLLPNPDGSPGTSTVHIRQAKNCIFTVLVSGQSGSVIEIGSNLMKVTDDIDSPCHAVYANETRLHGKLCRAVDCQVRIGKNRANNLTLGKSPCATTFKTKGSYNMFYECLDDINPFGAFDSYGSSGNFNVNWKGAGNAVFSAFRSGVGPWGVPSGKLRVNGLYEASGSSPVFRVEAPWTDLGCKVKGVNPLIDAGCSAGDVIFE